jgi:hypothetical protein
MKHGIALAKAQFPFPDRKKLGYIFAKAAVKICN